MQGTIQLVCNLIAAFVGLTYFLWTNTRPCLKQSRLENRASSRRLPTFRSLVVLIRPGLIFFTESAVRNALYLWLVTTIVALGSLYATALGVFNTIRWGLVMVPVQALEATALQFIAKPALKSLVLALIFEVPLAIFLTLFGAYSFASYISGSHEVARVTAHMLKTLDWCYIFYAMSTQLAMILFATRPNGSSTRALKAICSTSFHGPSLVRLPIWMWIMPGRITGLYSGSLVFSFFYVFILDGLWAWTLFRGKARMEAFRDSSV